MTPITLLILSLATWRIASLLAREAGPFDLLSKLRYRLGVRYNERSQAYGTTSLSEGILCLWCNSVWIGIALTIAYLLIWQWVLWIALPFALSAGALLVEGITGGKSA